MGQVIVDKMIDEKLEWSRINADVIASMQNPRRAYWITLMVCISMFACAIAAEIYQYKMGMGAAGLNNPHMWYESCRNVIVGNITYYSRTMA